MSKISEITVSTHTNELGGKIWNPAIRWTKKHAVLIELRDDTGALGLGECWCFDTYPDALIAFIRTEVIPDFLGLSVADIPAMITRLTQKATLTARHGILASALSGIDIAAWDLLSKQAEQPLWQHLNASGQGSALLYASGGLYGDGKGTRELVAEMSGLHSDGFGLLKMKIGGASIIEDIERVSAVIDALPSDAQLIVDGVYSYSADEALKVYEALPEGRIAAFQSPVKASNLTGMKQLSRASVPVMATEAEYREELHLRLIDEAEIAFLQTAPVACGGVSRVRALSELTIGTSTKLSLEVSSTAIALMAACHLAASDDRIAHVEYHTIHQVFFDQLALRQSANAAGRVSLPDRTGLGISLINTAIQIEVWKQDPNLNPEPRKAATS